MIRVILFSLASYLLGCITFAYYITKIFAGKNLNEIGSKSLGATNAARVLGKKGFIAVFLLDFCKGMLTVWLAQHFGFSNSEIFLFAAFVTLGHIFPIQLKFKGGKGVSPFTGAMFATNPYLIFPFVAAFLVSYLTIKNYTISGLIAIVLLPLYLIYFGTSYICIVYSIFVILVIVFAHRSNIADIYLSKR